MLSERAKQEILEAAGHYEHSQAAGIEALRVAQTEQGWVSQDTLRELAELLHLTAAELDHLATFYSLIFRAPVGRHIVMLCDSISCMIMGYHAVAGHFKRHFGISFGETTTDGRFTLIPIACLGNCDRAPTLIIDQDTYGYVTAESIVSILEKYP